MRFTILTYGSRGDVQPYIALGLALKQAGHEVKLAAPLAYRDFIYTHNLEYAPLPGDPTLLMRRAFTPGTRRLGPLALARAVVRAIAPDAEGLYPAIKHAACGSDAVIHSFLLTALGHQCALELDLPDFSAMVFALFSPTRAFACPLFPALRLGGERGPAYNYLSHREFARVFWHISRLGMDLLRRRGQAAPRLATWPFARSDSPFYPPPSSGWQTPILYGISPHTLPRPVDWPAYAHLTGYWFLDSAAGEEPNKELACFIEQGEPPVCVSFGSVISRDTRRVVSQTMAVLAKQNRRVVWVEGWGGSAAGGAAADTPNVFRIPSAPFAWLLPRVSALICHGGMGTVADGLRAGIPIAAIPFGADQPFWARRVQALGAGVMLDPRQVTGKNLADVIELVLGDEGIRQAAGALGRKIRAEEGAKNAVEVIEDYLAR